MVFHDRMEKLQGIAVHRDDRGALVVLDGPALPFAVARSYVAADLPVGAIRGEHAQRTGEQLLLCASGGLDIVTERAGFRQEVSLSQGEALHVLPMTWLTYSASVEGAVLVAYASNVYRPDDYVRDIDVFRRG
jgi:hypothetical protein